MPRTVECFDCHQQVENLAQHRSVCSQKRGGARGGGRGGLVECYDCHQHVPNIKEHRAGCNQSRLAKSAVDPVAPSAGPIAPNHVDSTDYFLVMDVSGSMTGVRLANAKEAVSQTFAEMEEHDRFSLITFDSKAFFKCKPRPVGQLRRQNELAPLLARVFTGGSTALYDAVNLAIEQVRSPVIPTKIVVLTDGEDNSSSKSMDDILRLLAERPNISLSIVHISSDFQPHPAYVRLCDTRGLYTMIEETLIVQEVVRITRLVKLQRGLSG